MRYRIRHYTRYAYDAPVNRAHNQTRLLLRRDAPGQICHQRLVRIHPRPDYGKIQLDHLGNRVLYLEIHRPHTEFKLFLRHVVERNTGDLVAVDASPPWEQVVESLRAATDMTSRQHRTWVMPSRLAPVSSRLRAFAEPHFTPGRPLLAAIDSLNRAIYREFRFDSKVTSISTPVTEVLERKRGVCQDFAHLMIAALRSFGLAARYVSGYLETLPPPGQPRTVGADASHAWVSVWCPDNGWQDFDPTNNLRPTDQHVVSAWGRDYDDVIPLNGVIEGGGTAAKMRVAVDVERLPDAPQ